METSLEDRLYDAVIQEDQDSVIHLVSQGKSFYFTVHTT